MKIYITKQDIAKARKADNFSLEGVCPIAQSLKRRGYKNVRAGYNIINADGERYSVTPIVRAFMKKFDCADLAKPCVFSVEKASV